MDAPVRGAVPQVERRALAASACPAVRRRRAPRTRSRSPDPFARAVRVARAALRRACRWAAAGEEVLRFLRRRQEQLRVLDERGVQRGRAGLRRADHEEVGKGHSIPPKSTVSDRQYAVSVRGVHGANAVKSAVHRQARSSTAARTQPVPARVPGHAGGMRVKDAVGRFGEDVAAAHLTAAGLRGTGAQLALPRRRARPRSPSRAASWSSSR